MPSIDPFSLRRRGGDANDQAEVLRALTGQPTRGVAGYHSQH
ncbi:MAG TPA: hypothetical protein VEN79_18920 [Terriglobia bacterium]|nr:hypothetical protein [Terriglobia bacterium]